MKNSISNNCVSYNRFREISHLLGVSMRAMSRDLGKANNYMATISNSKNKSITVSVVNDIMNYLVDFSDAASDGKQIIFLEMGDIYYEKDLR